jgi:hypothetical protein
MSEFTLGQCKSCGKTMALKDGRCIDCKIELPIDGEDFGDTLNQLFGKGWQDVARRKGTSS